MNNIIIESIDIWQSEIKVSRVKKSIGTLKNVKKNVKKKWSNEELYFGLEFSKKEFIGIIGGTSVYKKILKEMKEAIMKEVEINRKNGYELGVKLKGKFVEQDSAHISTSGPKELYIRWGIYISDNTGHIIFADYTLIFKSSTEDIIVGIGG